AGMAAARGRELAPLHRPAQRLGPQLGIAEVTLGAHGAPPELGVGGPAPQLGIAEVAVGARVEREARFGQRRSLGLWAYGVSCRARALGLRYDANEDDDSPLRP